MPLFLKLIFLFLIIIVVDLLIYTYLLYIYDYKLLNITQKWSLLFNLNYINLQFHIIYLIKSGIKITYKLKEVPLNLIVYTLNYTKNC